LIPNLLHPNMEMGAYVELMAQAAAYFHLQARQSMDSVEQVLVSWEIKNISRQKSPPFPDKQSAKMTGDDDKETGQIWYNHFNYSFLRK
jgi:hypothetical protein